MPTIGQEGSELVMQRHFLGLNTYTPPQDIMPGELVIADNVYVKGGECRSRPGKIAQLATAFDGPVYASEAYVKTDGTTALLLTSGGKLYVWNKGSNAAVELLVNGNSFNLNSAQTMFYRSGKYMYLVDGQTQFTNLIVDGSNNAKITSSSYSFQPGDVGKQITVTSGNGGFEYTDLAIQANTSQVTSVTRPFLATDVGGILVITSGTGFTTGTYSIGSVTSGVATLNASCGTTGPGGGTATFAAPGGVGFILGTFEVLSVASGAAIMTSVGGTAPVEIGTPGATGGQATMAGPLYRININPNGSYSTNVVTTPNPPNPPTQASLTNTVIEPCNSLSVWSGLGHVSGPAYNLLLNGSFENALNGNSHTPDYWTQSAPGFSPAAPSRDGGTYITAEDGSYVVTLDNPGQSISQIIASLPTYSPGAGAPATVALVYYFAGWFTSNDPTNAASATIDIMALNSSGAVLQTVSNVIIPPTYTSSTDWTLAEYVASFTGLSQPPTGIMVRITGKNGTRGGKFVCVDNVQLYPVDVSLTPTLAPTNTFPPMTMGELPCENSNPSSSGASGISAYLSANGLCAVGQQWLRRAYTTATSCTDLVIDPDNDNYVSSATLSAVPWAVGDTISITQVNGSCSANGTSTSIKTLTNVPVGSTVVMTSGVTGSQTVASSSFDGTTYTLTMSGTAYSGSTASGDTFTYSGVPNTPYITAIIGSQAVLSESAGTLGSTGGYATLVETEDYSGSNTVSIGWKQPGTSGSQPIAANLGFEAYSTLEGVTYTDLQSSTSNALYITSAANPFTSNDVGKSLVITAAAGSGLLPGVYTIVSVTSGVATLNITPIAPIVDLMISGSSHSEVSSVQFPFSADSVGGTLKITGGSGFNTGTYTITSVDPDTFVATCGTSNLGTEGAYGGVATLADCTTGSGYGQSYLANAIVWTNPGQQVTDSTGTYMTFDVSTVPYDVLKQTWYLYLNILADVPSTVNSSNLFGFGPISQAGNLSIGLADYSYVVTEVENTVFDASGNATGNTTDGVIESDSSPSTNNLTPTGNKAEAQITLASPVNESTNYFYLYRYGGVFPSEDVVPTARLVAELPVWTNTLDDAYSSWVTWDAATLTVTDNTPDSELYTVTTLASDRGAAPYGAQAICEWQNRLCLGVESTLYVSWLIAADQADGLYFNTLNIPNDPYGAIKGIQTPVGGADNDRIMALAPFGANLVILKQRSVWVLTGTDATNFQLSEFMAKGGANAGIGCVAPRAWALVNNSVCFLGPDAVWQYDGGDEAQPLTTQIEDWINPAVNGNPPIPASAYSGAVMIYHGRRLYLFLPTATWNYTDLVISPSNASQVYSVARPFLPTDVSKTLTISGGTGFMTGSPTISSVSNGIATLSAAAGTMGSINGTASLPADTHNTVAYVFDTRTVGLDIRMTTTAYEMRQGGWTRYLQMNATTAASLSSATDTNDMYLGGADGQLYELSLSQPGDVLTAGGSPTAIPWMVRSRGMGREQDGPTWWNQNKGNWALAKVTLNEPATVMLAAGVVGGPFVSMVTHDGGGPGIGPQASIRLRDRILSDVRGDAFFVQISGATVTPSVVTAVAVDLVKESIVSRL